MSLNTLEIVRLLESKGFTPSQAEGMIECMMIQNSDWVTKDFLEAKLGGLELKMVEQEKRIMSSIGNLKMDLIKWIVSAQIGMAGLILAVTGLILGIIYFLHAK